MGSIPSTMIGTLLLLVAAVSSQDTHYCPDGWIVSDIGDKIECIMLSGLKEKVTKADAAAICSFHEGWLVDMDEGHGPQKNNMLKKMIFDKEGEIGHHGGPGMQWEDQWWIGATVSGRHGDHNWGNWTWDHSGGEIRYYDWMRHEPNNWHSQNCLTFLKDQDIFGFGVYHWNDWGCDYVARYICEKAPMMPSTTAAPEPETTAAPRVAKYQQFPRVAKYMRRGLWN